jgi:alkylation response protein AidB-like acyl-CoA dehydrogenase
MDRYEFRRLDYSLSQDHIELQDAYRKLLSAHCPLDTVRAAEGTGFDKSLWERLGANGAASMALPEDVGGDGATMVDLVLVAEELGRSLAPVPWIDHVCTARLLARLGALPASDSYTADVVTGTRIAALDPRLENPPGPLLIPAGAIADEIVIRHHHDILKLRMDSHPAPVDNIAHLPMAWIDRATAGPVEMLGQGAAAAEEYLRALDEWRLLTAAALVGLVEQSLMIAAEFAKSRYTFGVPIGSLQGVSHPLAAVAVTVQGGRNLTRRAAWFHQYEPDARPELPAAAFHFMAEEATKAVSATAHVQGGLGATVEAPSTAYFARARGWTLAGGDPAASAVRVITQLDRRHRRATATSLAAADGTA